MPQCRTVPCAPFACCSQRCWEEGIRASARWQAGLRRHPALQVRRGVRPSRRFTGPRARRRFRNWGSCTAVSRAHFETCIPASSMFLTDAFSTIAAVVINVTLARVWQAGMLPIRMMWRRTEQRRTAAAAAVAGAVYAATEWVSPGCPQRCGPSFSPHKGQKQQLRCVQNSQFRLTVRRALSRRLIRRSPSNSLRTAQSCLYIETYFRVFVEPCSPSTLSWRRHAPGLCATPASPPCAWSWRPGRDAS